MVVKFSLQLFGVQSITFTINYQQKHNIAFQFQMPDESVEHLHNWWWLRGAVVQQRWRRWILLFMSSWTTLRPSISRWLSEREHWPHAIWSARDAIRLHSDSRSKPTVIRFATSVILTPYPFTNQQALFVSAQNLRFYICWFVHRWLLTHQSKSIRSVLNFCVVFPVLS